MNCKSPFAIIIKRNKIITLGGTATSTSGTKAINCDMLIKPQRYLRDPSVMSATSTE